MSGIRNPQGSHHPRIRADRPIQEPSEPLSTELSTLGVLVGTLGSGGGLGGGVSARIVARVRSARAIPSRIIPCLALAQVCT